MKYEFSPLVFCSVKQKQPVCDVLDPGFSQHESDVSHPCGVFEFGPTLYLSQTFLVVAADRAKKVENLILNAHWGEATILSEGDLQVATSSGLSCFYIRAIDLLVRNNRAPVSAPSSRSIHGVP